ncbi:Phage-related minor tail protein [Devosia sp. LC5]|uniref:hypothetical protein n=1 Tax=Devosia sp. LC5 TaxID=1502724 RepID=UPI0004E4531C|nr:hypothetical protein [Devosia sp. LC5]KFC62781.1 Phage-related minor tail protein [Devosia sp. LC5]
MAAVVGALRVDLGLNSAEFSAGLKKASAGLGNFAKTAGIGLAAVATAAAAAGAALGVAIKGAIDNADELSKTAQKVGVTTEALSRLNYAASLSDVSLGQLSTGLGRLTAGMSQIAQGSGGQAKMAFDALGISALNSAGQLRGTDEVLADVAERFGRMEDGATKTALAIALFGRSGADLIPMLNLGKNGLAELAAEADRLGITLDTNTGRAAEQFNDSITRLQATFQGVINKIMQGALPALNDLADKISDPQFAESAQAIGLAIVDAMKMAVDSINTVVGAFTALQGAMSWMNNNDMFGNAIDRGNGAGKEFQRFNTEDEAKALLTDALNSGQTGGPGADFYAGIFGAPASEIAASAEQVAAAFEPVITNTKEAAAGASTLKAAMSEGKAVFESTRTPAETYGLEVERLNALLEQGAIDQDTYNRAVLQAQDTFQKAEMAGNQLASTLASGLANVFTSVVDGSKSAVEAVGDLLKSLGQMLINQGFQALIGGIFGGGGGGIGSIFSGIFGGGGLKLGYNGIPGYANGTKSAPGGYAWVGERGPELVNLPRGAQVLPHQQSMATAANQASAVSIRLVMPEGWKAEVIDEARSGARQDTITIVQENEKALQNYRQNGG